MASAPPAAPALKPAAAPLRRLPNLDLEDTEPQSLPEADAAGPVVPEAPGFAAADSDEGVDPEPQIGDSIMVLREPWLTEILNGRKKMEIRCRNHKPGPVWVGKGGEVLGRVTISGSEELSIEQFRNLEHLHLWPADRDPPYNHKLCGLHLTEPYILTKSVPYWRPPSAIGWNLFRRTKEDLPLRSSAKKRKSGDEESAANREEEDCVDASERGSAA